ncbi:MAG: MHYT domain-containing protein [Gammaproteobacteria bacterium]
MEWYDKWFQIGQIPENALYGTYTYSLVLLSYVIAVLASYVALDVSSQLRRQTTRAAFAYWLVGGAFAMGAGIWAMHFIGMLV